MLYFKGIFFFCFFNEEMSFFGNVCTYMFLIFFPLFSLYLYAKVQLKLAKGLPGHNTEYWTGPETVLD